ncbi:hypothetical protein Dimus_005335 [Dionaea muscipula]
MQQMPYPTSNVLFFTTSRNISQQLGNREAITCSSSPPTRLSSHAKKDDSCTTMVVLKVDLYYEGCAKKVRRSIKHFEGLRWDELLMSA